MKATAFKSYTYKDYMLKLYLLHFGTGQTYHYKSQDKICEKC